MTTTVICNECGMEYDLPQPMALDQLPPCTGCGGAFVSFTPPSSKPRLAELFEALDSDLRNARHVPDDVPPVYLPETEEGEPEELEPEELEPEEMQPVPAAVAEPEGQPDPLSIKPMRFHWMENRGVAMTQQPPVSTVVHVHHAEPLTIDRNMALVILGILGGVLVICAGLIFLLF